MFFKHKYLTMPTLTPSKAVLKAATDLAMAILEVIPQNTVATEALMKFREIFNHTASEVEKQLAPREHTMYA